MFQNLTAQRKARAKSTTGFTLLETLIYLALFAILIGGFVVSAYVLFESSDRTQTKALLQEEKNFLVGKINWVLRGAAIVEAPAPNAAGATLTTTSYDGSTVTLEASGNDMLSNGTALNDADVAISKLVFIRTTAPGSGPDSVEAGFTISAKTPEGSAVWQTASTTVYLHK